MRNARRRIDHGKRSLLNVALAQTALGLSLPVLGATIMVSDLGDVSGSNCTLRDAIRSANNDVSVGGCVSGSGTDVIGFNTTLVPGTIQLSDNRIGIRSNVTIQGPGTDQLTIAANGLWRALDIDDGNPETSVSVSISQLTLSGTSNSQDESAVIYNKEALTIADVVFTDNGTVSVRNMRHAKLNLFESKIIGPGILATVGNVTVVGSLITRGGISTKGGTLTVANSTISNGGLGISSTGTVTVTNSTISDHANGGVFNSGGSVYLYSSTITRNGGFRTFPFTRLGGGLTNYAAPKIAVIYNTVISDSIGYADCYSDGALSPIIRNSVIEDGSCGALLTGDPRLGPLQDNGGPLPTQAVLSGSQLIDAGNNTLCLPISTDLTGNARTVDGNGDGEARCDIGAFEFVDVFGPEAILRVAPDIFETGANSYRVVVNFRDDATIDLSSFDDNDIAISNGLLDLEVAFVAYKDTDSGFDVSYTAMPPGGSWDEADESRYFIEVQADEVFDLATTGINTTESRVLGNFVVDIGGQIFEDTFEE